MVGVMGVLCGYLVGTLWPSFMSASNPGPVFMMVVAIVFSFAVAWIAHRGVNGSTSVNIAINVIQITALLVFAVMAFSYRIDSSGRERRLAVRFHLGRRLYLPVRDRQETAANGQTTETIVRDTDGTPKPQLDAAGKPVPFMVAYPEKDDKGQLPDASERRFGGRHSQLRLGVRSGHGRHSDSGRLRIGNGHGRRGQERQAGRSHRGHHLAAGAGSVLLSDRIFRGELLPEQRVHHAERHRVPRRPSAT